MLFNEVVLFIVDTGNFWNTKCRPLAEIVQHDNFLFLTNFAVIVSLSLFDESIVGYKSIERMRNTRSC